MNWYKKSQNIITDPEKQGIPYTGIGHGWQDREFEEPNIMWVFYNGEIRTVAESKSLPTHEYGFSEQELTDTYSGRYEPTFKQLTVLIPEGREVQKIKKEVPPVIMRKLRSTFPDVRDVYIY